MSDVTRLLEAANAGDRKAASDLLPLVYDELRTLAAAREVAAAEERTRDRRPVSRRRASGGAWPESGPARWCLNRRRT